MARKIKLDENSIKKYIQNIIKEEVEERFMGIPSRDDLNNKWGYQWNNNLSKQQNKALRKVNKTNIKAQGYKNAQEYEAGTGYQYGQEPQEQPQQQPQQPQIPQEYPFKSDKQKTGQFQTWFNQNMGGRLVVDGIWGPKTEQAYQQWLSQVYNN